MAALAHRSRTVIVVASVAETGVVAEGSEIAGKACGAVATGGKAGETAVPAGEALRSDSVVVEESARADAEAVVDCDSAAVAARAAGARRAAGACIVADLAD